MFLISQKTRHPNGTLINPALTTIAGYQVFKQAPGATYLEVIGWLDIKKKPLNLVKYHIWQTGSY
ncbi:MAG: hypothetical protein ABIS01_07540 [Ferruginibacter sp.]